MPSARQGWRGQPAADRGGVSRATIYNWEAGKGSPNDDYLRALLEARINPQWLLTGHGDIWATDPTEAQERLRVVRVALDADDVTALVRLLESLDPGDVG